jgi:hypothetical protein
MKHLVYMPAVIPRVSKIPSLAYIVNALDSSTGDNIRRVVLGYFTPEVIHHDKNILWETFDVDTLELCNSEEAKPRHEFEVDDILGRSEDFGQFKYDV